VTIFTIGHSVRPLDQFVALLNAHRISQLADVRTVPKSRRHPHFAREALEVSLPVAGIAYRHMPGLGGLRKPRRDSRNTAWRVGGFRGYADYMETPAFDLALKELIEWGTGLRRGLDPRNDGETGVDTRPLTAIMCAEAVWWKCHRQLIADALVARGVEVRHISTESSAPVHTLTGFARLTEGRVSYTGLSLLDTRGSDLDE
jgi:uncharacterized protein (DUF488 family)